MKITSKNSVAPQKRTQHKQASGSNFGSILSTEMGAISSTSNNSPITPKQNAPQPDQQESYSLFEQASELLDQALTQLEAGDQPTDETLQSIQKIRSELDLLGGQIQDQSDLAEAKTLLAVEAQRIQAMKH